VGGGALGVTVSVGGNVADGESTAVGVGACVGAAVQDTTKTKIKIVKTNFFISHFSLICHHTLIRNGCQWKD